MLKGTVIRDDSVWHGHPDVAFFNEHIVVVFRESDRHLTTNPTSIKIVTKHRNKQFSLPIQIAASKHRLNCPRLSVIDDTLYVICDQVEKSSDYFKSENDESKTNVFLWSTQDLIHWTGPIKTGITGIVPDRICRTNEGFTIATHTFVPNRLVQNIWHASNMEGPWQKFPLAHHPPYNFCEASVCKIENEYIALIRENSALGLPAFICQSEDAKTWSDPKSTRLFSCHRPVMGVLKSGNILTTYREASFAFTPGLWAKNTFACLTEKNSPIYKDGFKKSIILPLDHDQNKRSDSGYTGWIQLADESIFIVNYITADAPRPYIKWYSVFESDF